MKKIFGADGPVMRALSDIMTLLVLNLLTLLCCIPVITAGAALSSLHYMIMKMLEGEDGQLFSRYFKQFKGNIRTCTPVWLLFVAFAVVFWLGYRAYLTQLEGNLRFMLIISWVAFIILAALFVWAFPLMARFDNTLSGTLKNSLILAVGKLPRTLLMVAINIVVPFVLWNWIRLLPLAFLFGISAPAYFCALVYNPVLKPMVEAALEKAESLETQDDGEREPDTTADKEEDVK